MSRAKLITGGAVLALSLLAFLGWQAGQAPAPKEPTTALSADPADGETPQAGAETAEPMRTAMHAALLEQIERAQRERPERLSATERAARMEAAKPIEQRDANVQRGYYENALTAQERAIGALRTSLDELKQADDVKPEVVALMQERLATYEQRAQRYRDRIAKLN